MTTDPITMSPETPVARVLEKIVETRYRSFPVVEDGMLVGVISREDVVGALRTAAVIKDRA